MEDEQSYVDNYCKLKVSSKRNIRAPVFIADFSNGEVKSSKNDLKFQCFKKDISIDNMGCITTRELVATNSRLNYIGSSSQSALNYFVGITNKTTGKMKLCDCVFFRMKPDLKKVVDSSSHTTTSISYWEEINELSQNFGSKAKKRSLNTLKNCAVDATPDKSITINNSVLRPSPDRFSNADYPHQIDYLPPQNRSASIPSEVFDINNVISSEENNALNKEAQELLVAPADNFDKMSSFCKYVKMRFHNVNATNAKILLYYNYLISFQHLKYSDMRKKDPAPAIRNPYKKNILEKFTLLSSNDKGKVSRSCPNQMKDKLVSYILVLALFIDGFMINLDEIQVDLNNIGIPKLKNIAEVLGCHIGKKKIGEEVFNYAELKLPLNDIKYKKPSFKKF